VNSSSYIAVSGKMREQTNINGYIFHESVLWKNIRISLVAVNHNLINKFVSFHRFLVKRILEVVVGFQVVMCLFQQWIIPSVKNSLIPFSVSMKRDSLCVLLLWIYA
jgi:hypothetical protein